MNTPRAIFGIDVHQWLAACHLGTMDGMPEMISAETWDFVWKPNEDFGSVGSAVDVDPFLRRRMVMLSAQT